MSNEEIRLNFESYCHNISWNQKKIQKLRQICKHENTHEGIYSYRIGNFMNATICDIYGEIIKIHDTPIEFKTN